MIHYPGSGLALNRSASCATHNSTKVRQPNRSQLIFSGQLFPAHRASWIRGQDPGYCGTRAGEREVGQFGIKSSKYFVSVDEAAVAQGIVCRWLKKGRAESGGVRWNGAEVLMSDSFYWYSVTDRWRRKVPASVRQGKVMQWWGYLGELCCRPAGDQGTGTGAIINLKHSSRSRRLSASDKFVPGHTNFECRLEGGEADDRLPDRIHFFRTGTWMWTQLGRWLAKF